MTVVEMQPWHLMWVAMHMREEDRQEFGSAYGEDDPQKWACRRALAPGIAWAVLDARDLPVACIGIYEDHDGVATGWLVATPEWRCGLKTIYKGFKAVWQTGEFKTIITYVRPGRPPARKFIEWLGFSYRGTLPNYCRNGEPIDVFSIAR